MKPDQERVNNLLRDTVTLLCKNGLTYSDELRVEALIGVTVDSNDVFLVHINERFGPGGETKSTTQVTKEDSVNNMGQGLSNNSSRDSQTPHQSPGHPVQRTASTDSGSVASPSWGTRQPASTTAPQVDLSRVKLESVEVGEDIDGMEECLIVRSPQAVARQAHIVAGQRRIHSRHNSTSSFHHTPPSSHHTQPSTSGGGGDDAQAMRQQYSQSHSMASSDGSFTDYDPDTGEPPLKIKKQASDDQDDAGDEGADSSAYYHGGGQQEASSQWPDIADIAAHQAQHAFQDGGDGRLSADGRGTLPGCSTWPMPAGSQRTLIPGTPGSDMPESQQWDFAYHEAPGYNHHDTPKSHHIAPRTCRPPRQPPYNHHDAPKSFPCIFPGCGKEFSHGSSLSRHKTKEHKPPKERRWRFHSVVPP